MTQSDFQSIPDLRRRYGAYVAGRQNGNIFQRYLFELIFIGIGILLAIGGTILLHGAPGATGFGIAFVAFAVSSIVSRRKADAGRSNLVRTGVPVWGVLVQANSTLFAPGPYPSPCLVLFSFDPAGGHLDYLQRLAHNVFNLKGTKQQDKDLRCVAGLVTDERAVKNRRRKLPVSFTGGPTVYCADLTIIRTCLPQGYLTERVLPCIAEPGDAGALELLP